MTEKKLHDIPSRCPITGQDLHVSELSNEAGDVTLRGTFRVPRMARLDPEQRHFLETFLRARGVISTVEKELGISYPTVRSRLDALLATLDLTPIKAPALREKNGEVRRQVLQDLEEGRISPEEAKAKLRAAGVR